MQLLNGSVATELDADMVEELICAGGSSDAQQQLQLEGLQQFSTQPTSRVVHVRAAAIKSKYKTGIIHVLAVLCSVLVM